MELDWSSWTKAVESHQKENDMADFPVPGDTRGGNPDYPFAPSGWSFHHAEQKAKGENIELSTDHIMVVKSLQEYFHKNDERFHAKGGMRYLYKILPGGPVAQGCRLAGLETPSGAVDRSFGSVQ